jgi:hypothetical protein
MHGTDVEMNGDLAVYYGIEDVRLWKGINSKNRFYAFSKIVDFIYTRWVVGPLFLPYGQFGKVWRCTFLCFLALFKELPDGGHVKSPEGVEVLRIGRWRRSLCTYCDYIDHTAQRTWQVRFLKERTVLSGVSVACSLLLGCLLAFAPIFMLHGQCTSCTGPI